jgi:hypothetical protein
MIISANYTTFHNLNWFIPKTNLLKTNQGSCTPKVHISCFQAIKGNRNYNNECEYVKGIVLNMKVN